MDITILKVPEPYYLVVPRASKGGYVAIASCDGGSSGFCQADYCIERICAREAAGSMLLTCAGGNLLFGFRNNELSPIKIPFQGVRGEHQNFPSISERRCFAIQNLICNCR